MSTISTGFPDMELDGQTDGHCEFIYVYTECSIIPQERVSEFRSSRKVTKIYLISLFTRVSVSESWTTSRLPHIAVYLYWRDGAGGGCLRGGILVNRVQKTVQRIFGSSRISAAVDSVYSVTAT